MPSVTPIGCGHGVGAPAPPTFALPRSVPDHVGCDDVTSMAMYDSPFISVRMGSAARCQYGYCKRSIVGGVAIRCQHTHSAAQTQLSSTKMSCTIDLALIHCYSALLGTCNLAGPNGVDQEHQGPRNCWPVTPVFGPKVEMPMLIWLSFKR